MTVLLSTDGLILFKNSFMFIIIIITIIIIIIIIIIIVIIIIITVIITINSLARKKIDWDNFHGISLSYYDFIIVFFFIFHFLRRWL